MLSLFVVAVDRHPRRAAISIRTTTHFVLLFSHDYKPNFSYHFAERAREQAGPVKIDRFYPEGVQSHNPVAKVAVTFNQPMVSVGTLDDLESQVWWGLVVMGGD